MFGQEDKTLRTEAMRLGQTAIIAVRGPAGLLEAEDVGAWLDQMAGDGVASVILDLSDLDRTWAIAVAVLVAAHRKSDPGGLDVSVVVRQPGVFDTLIRNGLRNFVGVYESVDIAGRAEAAGTHAPRLERQEALQAESRQARAGATDGQHGALCRRGRGAWRSRGFEDAPAPRRRKADL